MDTRRILIDTSIIIGYFRRKEKENTILYNLYESSEEICVSSVTVFEIFYGSNPEHETMIARIFEGFTIIPFDAEVARIASREYQKLRARGKYIEVRELVVGATALVKKLPLATLNTRSFRMIPDIQIVF